MHFISILINHFQPVKLLHIQLNLVRLKTTQCCSMCDYPADINSTNTPQPFAQNHPQKTHFFIKRILLRSFTNDNHPQAPVFCKMIFLLNELNYERDVALSHYTCIKVNLAFGQLNFSFFLLPLRAIVTHLDSFTSIN